MKKLLPILFVLVLLISMLLVACAPSEEELKATSEVLKTAYAETEAVAPTRTSPPPAPPAVKRSDFDKCANSGRDVRYSIHGEGVTGVSLTYENDTLGTNQGDYKIPYCRTFYDFVEGDFLYISAQIIQGTGMITCRIWDGDKIISEASASGFASIAQCSGSK